MLGTNHLNFGYESSGYETSLGTKRSVGEEGVLQNLPRNLLRDLPQHILKDLLRDPSSGPSAGPSAGPSEGPNPGGTNALPVGTHHTLAGR